MATEEELAIKRIIRASDVGKYLVMIKAERNGDGVWAKFEPESGHVFTVTAASDNDSTHEFLAYELIVQAMIKMSN